MEGRILIAEDAVHTVQAWLAILLSRCMRDWTAHAVSEASKVSAESFLLLLQVSEASLRRHVQELEQKLTDLEERIHTQLTATALTVSLL